ncbi:MAG: ABC transporter ATP-binding protein/permease [Eubacterium sp.]|nr:ABC transporter ATP-binding protein/permease [Eubacterium sp.]
MSSSEREDLKNVARRSGPPQRGAVYLGERPSIGKTLARLLSYLKNGYLIHFIIVCICLILASIGQVAGTYLLRYLIDDYITPFIGSDNPDYSTLYLIVGAMIIAYVTTIATTYIYNRLMITVSQGVMNRLRKDMFAHMEKLSLKYFDTNSNGDLMSRYTNDADTLRMFLSRGMTQMLSGIVTVVSVFISMITLSIPLTGVVVLLIIFMLILTRKIGGLSAKYYRAQQKSLGKVNGFVEEMIGGQKVIKVFCHEEEAKKEFKELNDELFNNASKANILTNILMPIMAQLGNLTYLIIAIVGATFAVTGTLPITLGILASFLTFTKNLMQPIAMLSQQINSVIMSIAGAERIFNLLDEEPEVDDGNITLVNAEISEDGTIRETNDKSHHWAWKKDNGEYVKLAGDVRFNNVDFGYSDEKLVLKDLNLFAKPGNKIAFVGHTGAGKTTITNLINRFYDINQGEILYDGINVKDIKKDDLRHSLGIVLQDTHLFTGTIRENIRFGKLDATDEEVENAAKLANAHYFISHLKDGYDTVIDDDGGSLSQGQCQLLAIARAAVADPPVLILDEATSSIDTRTEAVISQGMDRLMEGRTVFVIAHRLSTVQNANVILVLENGKVIERGDHDELMGQKGTYYKLYTGSFAEG